MKFDMVSLSNDPREMSLPWLDSSTCMHGASFLLLSMYNHLSDRLFRRVYLFTLRMNGKLSTYKSVYMYSRTDFTTDDT